MNVTGISKAKVFPINSRSTYSFKNGNPTLDFEIAPDAQRLLDVKSLRLNFLFDVLDSNGNRVNNQNVNGTGAVECKVDSRVGVNSVIDVLRLSNFKNENIEEIRNYSRLLASTLPAMTSFDAYKNWCSNKNQAYAREDVEAMAVNGTLACSLPLRSGLFNSGSPINTNAMDGLKISIQLSPDNFVLYGSNASTCNYQLSAVSLTYNWIHLEAPLPLSNDMIQYPTYSSFINIVQSSDDQQSLMMNLGSVRAAFANYCKTANLNNFSANSLETNRIQDNAGADKKIKNVVHMRNNVKFPKKYDINERITVTNGAYEAQLGRDYLDCFRPFNKISSCLQSPETQGFKSVDAEDYSTPDANRYVGGVGCNYDMLQTGMGSEFKNSMYSVRLQSDMTDSTPNTSFTYALSNQALAVRKQNVQPVQ